jgi:myo-inositol 2-dehydrogenase / D-chiro-inositol 1-dehydrogenase
MKKMKRRIFLKNATAISTFTILTPKVAFGSQNNSAIRIGMIGCGNRGTGVLTAMSKNTNAHIIALADILNDKLLTAQDNLSKCNAARGFAKIQKENMYQGSKAYLQLLDNKNIDAVLISTPAYAHPEILEAAVAAGKHAYCEKPAAIDIYGCNRVLKIGETIKNRLSVVLGFQIRYATPYVEMVKRIQRGDIGEIVCVQLYYFSSGTLILPHEGMSDNEARIRNHFVFNELSGGIFLDQAIHMIDVCNWTLQSKPLQAIGSGGRKGHLDFGNAWTNYQVIYKYPDDVNVGVQSSKIGPSFGDVCARFVGTTGIAEAHYSGGVYIKGENAWDSGIVKSGADLSPQQIALGTSLSSLDDADQNKGKSFINSIETGNYLNLLQPGCESTISAIMGREAAIRQKVVTWDEICSSSDKIDPKLDLTQFDK